MYSLKEMRGEDSSVDDPDNFAKKDTAEVTSFDTRTSKRPRQLYEAAHFSSHRWNDLGDWAPEHEGREHEERKKVSEKHKARRYSYRSEEGNSHHRKTVTGRCFNFFLTSLTTYE